MYKALFSNFVAFEEREADQLCFHVDRGLNY